jgi:hypothetical protein
LLGRRAIGGRGGWRVAPAVGLLLGVHGRDAVGLLGCAAELHALHMRGAAHLRLAAVPAATAIATTTASTAAAAAAWTSVRGLVDADSPAVKSGYRCQRCLDS